MFVLSLSCQPVRHHCDCCCASHDFSFSCACTSGTQRDLYPSQPSKERRKKPSSSHCTARHHASHQVSYPGVRQGTELRDRGYPFGQVLQGPRRPEHGEQVAPKETVATKQRDDRIEMKVTYAFMSGCKEKAHGSRRRKSV